MLLGDGDEAELKKCWLFVSNYLWIVESTIEMIELINIIQLNVGFIQLDSTYEWIVV